jgi:hypothetical protein
MFWGAFTWDAKCKPHIWEKKTPAEKKAAAKEIKKWNEKNEERLKVEWELETAIRRLNIVRNPGGRKPEWKFTAKTGKQVRRKGKGGNRLVALWQGYSRAYPSVFCKGMPTAMEY